MSIAFDGSTFNKKLDGKRLTGQWLLVFDVMKDGSWRTLREISEQTGFPEASISARLRDFRKKKFGGHTVERKRRGHWCDGVWEYQLLTSFKEFAPFQFSTEAHQITVGKC